MGEPHPSQESHLAQYYGIVVVGVVVFAILFYLGKRNEVQVRARDATSLCKSIFLVSKEFGAYKSSKHQGGAPVSSWEKAGSCQLELG